MRVIMDTAASLQGKCHLHCLYEDPFPWGMNADFGDLVVGGHLENVCDGVTKQTTELKQTTLTQRDVFWDSLGWQEV